MRARFLAALGAAIWGAALEGRAQEPAVAVRVVEIAGANLYLDAGTAAGLAPADTVEVRRAAGGDPAGILVVVAASEKRAVAVFGGRPFPVTRGDVLMLTIRGAGAPARSGGVAIPAPPRQRLAPRAWRPARLEGSAAFEVVGRRSTTYGLGSGPEQVSRDFAVPTLRLQAVIRDLPGGGRLTIQGRASQQTGSSGLFDRGTVVRVYEAYYEREAGSARFLAGRFFGPYEPFSGAWDGLLVRWGGPQGVSAGLAAGFQPARGDERLSTQVPKVTAFAGFRWWGPGWRVESDLSAHAWRPRDGTPDRTFVGWSQRLGLGGVRLDHLMELDRQVDGGWKLERLDARAAAPLASRIELSAEYFRDRLGSWGAPPDSEIAGTDRLLAGARYRFPGGWLSGDVAWLAPAGGSRGRSYSAQLQLPELAGAVSLKGSVSYWTMGGNRGLVAIPQLGWPRGPGQPTIAYEMYRSSVAAASTVSHGGEVMLRLPVGEQVEWLLRLSARYGQNLRSAGIVSSLRLAF